MEFWRQMEDILVKLWNYWTLSFNTSTKMALFLSQWIQRMSNAVFRYVWMWICVNTFDDFLLNWRFIEVQESTLSAHKYRPKKPWRIMQWEKNNFQIRYENVLSLPHACYKFILILFCLVHFRSLLFRISGLLARWTESIVKRNEI